MRESRELTFSEEDKKLYGKLDIVVRDLCDTMSFGAFILRKGWRAKPWSRGTTYLQQSAFVTSMVVSYGRAFSNGRDWGRLTKSFIESFSGEEASLHKQIIKERNQIYAHSDLEHYPVSPWESDHHSDIIRFHVREVPSEEIAMLSEMCLKVIRSCREEQVKIKARYIG